MFLYKDSKCKILSVRELRIVLGATSGFCVGDGGGTVVNREEGGDSCFFFVHSTQLGKGWFYSKSRVG